MENSVQSKTYRHNKDNKQGTNVTDADKTKHRTSIINYDTV